MTAEYAALIYWLLAYLIGAIPFGYLLGRIKGVNLFEEGSKNIGATNTGRVLGPKYGYLCFALDFLKGALPVAVSPWVVSRLSAGSSHPFSIPQLTEVGSAVAVFVGHLFPVYLGFRGGKGVATGAGAAVVVAPLPAFVGVLAWITVVLVSRMVSLASIAAAMAIIFVRILISTPQNPFGIPMIAGSLFCLVGGLIVIIKHHSNIRRILQGSESKIINTPTKQKILAGLHCLAVGFWFGGAAFFNFLIAPAIFNAFEKVVADQPSSRTANQRIQSETASPEEKKALGNALAGSAVAPIFPRLTFCMIICGLISFITSYAWFHLGRIHRIRMYVIFIGITLVLLNWPIAEWVSQLRFDRYQAEKMASAEKLFVPIHLLSMAIGAITNIFTGAALFFAGQIPKIKEELNRADADVSANSAESAE